MYFTHTLAHLSGDMNVSVCLSPAAAVWSTINSHIYFRFFHAQPHSRMQPGITRQFQTACFSFHPSLPLRIDCAGSSTRVHVYT